MRLQNKKTGEIGELQITEKHCAVAVGNGTASCGIEIYSSLAELNKEWEDYEEPKGMRWVDVLGANDGRVVIQYSNEEEAQEAVEKLKAWKRLKDKGFRFTGCGRYHWTGEEWPHIAFSYPNFDDLFDDSETVADLDLLFGGEE